MNREEIASNKLRQMVEGFKRVGLPSTIPLEEAAPTLTDVQKEMIMELTEFSKKEQALDERGIEAAVGNERWQFVMEVRKHLQKAILDGLIHLQLIQEYVINFGAIPDPDHGWVYFVLPDSSYSCWECGAEILAKNVCCSIHYPEMHGAGGGEVLNKQVPYCPTCEKEPPDTSVVYETLADDLARTSLL